LRDFEIRTPHAAIARAYSRCICTMRRRRRRSVQSQGAGERHRSARAKRWMLAIDVVHLTDYSSCRRVLRAGRLPSRKSGCRSTRRSPCMSFEAGTATTARPPRIKPKSCDRRRGALIDEKHGNDEVFRLMSLRDLIHIPQINTDYLQHSIEQWHADRHHCWHPQDVVLYDSTGNTKHG